MHTDHVNAVDQRTRRLSPGACRRHDRDPQGLTLKFEAEFVKAGTMAGGQQSFTVVTPPPVTTGRLLRRRPHLLSSAPDGHRVMAAGGRQTRTFRLASLFGERSLSADKVRGEARNDFGIQSATSYLGDGRKGNNAHADWRLLHIGNRNAVGVDGGPGDQCGAFDAR